MLKINKQSLKKKKGFTLMEVLVTVIIVGVLAAVAYPVYSKSIAKARATEAVNLLEIVKNKQIHNFATKSEYITSLEDLSKSKLVNGSAVVSDSAIVINEDYYVSLDATKGCASVSYKKSADAEPIFTFSSGYESSELGCTGSVCSSFGDTVEASAVCDVSDPYDSSECKAPGNPPCASCTWNSSLCQYDCNCTGEDTCNEGATQSCTIEGKTGCSKTCSGGVWGECGNCSSESENECEPGEAGAFGSCPGVCKADGSGFECSGQNDTHYCESVTSCLAFDTTCPANIPDGHEQKQTCDDGVTHLSRTYSRKTGWSCEFDTVACVCNPR